MSKDALPSSTTNKIDSPKDQKVPGWKTRPLLINQHPNEPKSTDDVHKNKSEFCDSTSPCASITSLSNSLHKVHNAASDVSVSNITIAMTKQQQQTGSIDEK